MLLPPESRFGPFVLLQKPFVWPFKQAIQPIPRERLLDVSRALLDAAHILTFPLCEGSRALIGPARHITKQHTPRMAGSQKNLNMAPQTSEDTFAIWTCGFGEKCWRMLAAEALPCPAIAPFGERFVRGKGRMVFSVLCVHRGSRFRFSLPPLSGLPRRDARSVNNFCVYLHSLLYL